MSKKDRNIIIGSCAGIALGLAGIFTLAVKYGEPSPQRYYYATSDNNNDCNSSTPTDSTPDCSGPSNGANGPGGM
jgi:hypothetical protein